MITIWQRYLTNLSRRRSPLLAAIALAATAMAGPVSASTGVTEGPLPSLVELFLAQWKYASGDNHGNDCSDNWSPAVTNDMAYLIPWFPENKAAYWIYGYDREQAGDDLVLRLKGKFPHARYMSFHLYDGNTGRLVTGRSSFKDLQLAPDQGSSNPFVAGVDREVSDRDYGLIIAPEGAVVEAGTNVLRIPDNVRYPLFIYRVYRADDQYAHDGGVALPQVLAYSAGDGQPVTSCPEPVMPVSEGLDPTKRPDTRLYYSPQIHAYSKHPEYSGLLPNSHNYYGQTGVTRDLGEVALLRFKAATTPDTAGDGGSFSHKEDLRYWSLCISGDVFTNTSSCLWDDVVVKDEDGYVKVAIGPDTDAFRAAASAKGYNPMAWGYHLRHVVYHRHMQNDSGFKNSYKDVPHIDFSKPLNEQWADRYIGDYAFTGFYCSEKEFVSGDCGFESSDQ